MLWKKATCLKKVMPRSYEVVLEGTKYRRNRKDLIQIQESPGVEPYEPPPSDNQSQRVIEPI